MKTKLSSRRYRAFTLIELLTVIAIIAILAAMLLPVLAAAKRHALKVKAQLQCNDIVTAIQAYDSAYGRFPVSQAAQGAANPDFTYGGTLHDAGGVLSTPIGTTPVGSGNPPILTNAEVIAILMDITNYPGTTESTANTNHEKNPQMTKFLKATMVSDNTLPGVGTDLVYRDPWGNPYIITMDLNYDDMCKDALYSISKVSQQSGSTGYNGLIDPTDSTGADNNFEYRGKVMVWSAGPDGKIDANTPATQGYNKDNILSWK